MVKEQSRIDTTTYETIKATFEEAVQKDMVANGIASGAGSVEVWMDTISEIAEELEIPFRAIKPATAHDNLRALFNAHKEAILGQSGPCIVCFDASENDSLPLSPQEYIAFNNEIENLMFKNGHAIYVHVMGGEGEPNIFVASKSQPATYETKARLKL